MLSPADDSGLWKRAEDLFHRALDVPTGERSQFIERECGSDRRLFEDVNSLIHASHESGERLEQIVREAASDVWAEGTRKQFVAGDRFAHYAIVSQLGAGGMGQVYLAEDLQLRRKVALKTLLPEAMHDEESLQRFRQEALAASALNHPNILTIYEVGSHDGLPFIASEFIEGFTVRDKLAAGQLPLRDVVEIAIQVAAGLDAAHAAGVIHRDIKPENILVREDGFVKIVDFGIARVSEERTLREEHESDARSISPDTRPGMVLGTARYMSPEQARGGAIDARTDVFSLGAVIYEMTAGKAPFEGDTPSDLLAEILKVDPPSLRVVVPNVPERLIGIIEKCMCKKREQRYATAGELLRDLKAFREDAEFHARLKAGSPADAKGRLTSRRNAALAVVFAAVALASVYWIRNLTSKVSTLISGTPRTLAILPFRNIRPDPATDFLGYSLADAVITKMQFVNSVIVRPSTSIDRYRNQTVDPRKAGADLNVNTLLTGSFLKDGDDLRINTQLIDVRQVRVIWQDTVDVKYEKLLSVQDRVAQQIIAGLELNLSPSEAGKFGFGNPTNGSAYESYLRGVDLYALNDFPSAIKALEKSASLEPGYALTWAHLGRSYTTNASLQFGGREQYRKAMEAYRKSIELNSSLVEPRVYMANLFTDTGHVEEAVPLLLTALKSKSNSAEAHWELGYAYRFGGLLDDSIRECERAREIDPDVKINSSAINTYLYVGEYDKFLAGLPDHDSAYILFYRGFGEYYKRDFGPAIAHFDRAFQLDPSLLQADVGEALADSKRQRAADGLRLLRETEARIERTGLSDAEGLYKVSQAFAVLGDRRSALRILRQTIDGGFFCYPYFETDPLIVGIRTEPAFPSLMAQARERYERFRTRFAGR